MTVYAEEVNYWRTSQASADTWIDRAVQEIESVGGRVIGHTSGTDLRSGRTAYCIMFRMLDQDYKIVWPALPTKTNKSTDIKAARVQAATALYHDIKSRVVHAKFHGAQAAFFQYLQLPDGTTAAQINPKLLTSNALLTEGAG